MGKQLCNKTNSGQKKISYCYNNNMNFIIASRDGIGILVLGTSAERRAGSNRPKANIK
jgi:hypothetical protein